MFIGGWLIEKLINRGGTENFKTGEHTIDFLKN